MLIDNLRFKLYFIKLIINNRANQPKKLFGIICAKTENSGLRIDELVKSHPNR